MPIKPGQEIYLNGADMDTPDTYGYTYLIFYDKDFNLIQTCNWYGGTSPTGSIHYVDNTTNNGFVDKTKSYYEFNENGLHHFVIHWNKPQEYAYVRLSIDITESTDTDALIFFFD